VTTWPLTSNNGPMRPNIARQLWMRLETINAVTYFCAECREAPGALGLRGFWMGYFGSRAAPLGAVPPGVVEATFYNFHPDRVRRAIPEAWAIAAPAALVRMRAKAAAAALRRLLGDETAERLAIDVNPAMTEAIWHGDAAGRPLFAANRDLDPPDDVVARLWWSATTMREHRGDGHVALLVGAGLDGCEVHVLASGDRNVDPELFQRSRGWSADDWQAAVDRLASRGLVTHHGEFTAAGRELLAEIEHRTDELAERPYAALGDEGVVALVEALGPPARTIAASGEVMYPNPMGLPRPDDGD
jgi:hypothetical protein